MNIIRVTKENKEELLKQYIYDIYRSTCYAIPKYKPSMETIEKYSHQNLVSQYALTLEYIIRVRRECDILLRILDNFIVSGLKSIMEVGCVALHSYENVLMSKRYEDMMQFLINDMLRSDFFSKKNTEFVENFFNETKISKKLVKNIEEEFRQEQKMKPVIPNKKNKK